ncbi:MAG TPA: response regulator [Trebonia sp.]
MVPRLLIVDDSPQFRAAAAELLAGQGLEVLAMAADAVQAAVAAACACPDGILLDINLPGPDGFAAAALLAGACPRVRIVLTSANMATVPDDVLKTCGAAAFVPKEDLAATDLGALFRPGDAQA